MSGPRPSQTLPATMEAIDPTVTGGPKVMELVERSVPVPAEGEYFIRVAAAGVSRPDVIQRLGLYPPPPGAPSILGLELSGTIVGAGPGADASRISQPVAALVAGGGYAEYCCAPERQCLPVPEALSMIEAAALPETLYTVWSNLFDRAGAVSGDTVLVHGGTSGIGTMAIMLGNLFGFTVIVTCGSDDKCSRALEIGAAHAINYRRHDFVEEVKRLTGGRGVAAVLDMISGDYVARNLKCLADDGRHVTIAVQGGAEARINMVEIMTRRLVMTGSTLRARPVPFKGEISAALMRSVWPHISEGRLKPVVDATFSLADAAEAHERIESGDHVGKIVLVIDRVDRLDGR